MKTLKQIKNDYAISVYYLNWNELKVFEPWNKIDYHENQVMILVQKECLKLASENAHTKDVKFSNDIEVDKESITNENNIIK